MKTWTVPLLASLAIVSASARDPQLTSPQQTSQRTAAPASLQFAHMSPTTILLYWDMPKTEEPIRIKVTATPLEGLAKSVVVVAKPYLKMDGLTAGMDYRIRVFDVRANGSEYPNGSLDVRTRSEDFFAPIIIDNSLGEYQHPIGATYDTTWRFREDDRSVITRSGCEVLYCTSTCRVEMAFTDTTRHTSVLEYDTEHTIAVFAVFRKADGSERRVASDLLTFTTMIGKPWQVQNFSVSQEPNTLDIDIEWSPPQRVNGKLQHYNLQLSMRGRKVVDEQLKETKFTFSIKESEQIADFYVVKVRAVNNGDESHRYGDFVEEHYTLKKPEKPTVDFFKIEATFIDVNIAKQGKSDLSFKIKYLTDEVRLTEENHATLPYLEPYTSVDLRISACLTLKDWSRFCGDSSTFWIRTKAGAPSGVQNLNATATDRYLKLSWDEPEIAAGPIDGYTVRIRDLVRNRVDEVNTTGTSLLFFRGNSQCFKYSFSVLAYNIDESSGDKMVGWEDYILYSEECEEITGIPLWTIVLVGILVLVVLGGTVALCLLVFRRCMKTTNK